MSFMINGLYVCIYKAHALYIYHYLVWKNILILINQYPRLQVAKKGNRYYSGKERRRRGSLAKGKISEHIWRLILFNIPPAMIDFLHRASWKRRTYCDSRKRRSDRVSVPLISDDFRSRIRSPASICRKSLFKLSHPTARDEYPFYFPFKPVNGTRSTARLN